MKLETLIKQLEKAKASYVKKHGIEPVVWTWDEEGLHICAKVQRESGLTRAKKPYMTIEILPPGV